MFAVVCGMCSILSIEQAIHLECNGLFILAGLIALVMWGCIFEASQQSRNQNKKNRCPKCDEIVIEETCKDIDYPYVCLSCDENFYEIELND